jgi:predicted RNA binding protein YcfA (HicA-like mRNA interferase family)
MGISTASAALGRPHGAGGTAAAMMLATALTLPQPFGDEPAAERLGADVQPFPGQLLAGEGRSKVGVALPVDGENGQAEVGVRLMVGRPAAQTVNEGLISVGLEALLNASDLADAFNGFTLVRRKGSIRYYGKAGWARLIRVGYHGLKGMPPGSFHAILKAARLPPRSSVFHFVSFVSLW